MNLHKHTSFLDDNESVLLQNLRADRGGKLRAGFESSSLGSGILVSDFEPAYGAMYPKSDYFLRRHGSSTWDFSSAAESSVTITNAGTSITMTEDEGLHYAAGHANWQDAYVNFLHTDDFLGGVWYRMRMVFVCSSGTPVVWTGDLEIIISLTTPSGAGFTKEFQMLPKRYRGNRGGIYVKGNDPGTLTSFSAACTSMETGVVIVDTIFKTPDTLYNGATSGRLWLSGHPNGSQTVGMPTWTLTEIEYRAIPYEKDLTSTNSHLSDINGNFHHVENKLFSKIPGNAQCQELGSMFSKTYDNSHSPDGADSSKTDDTSLNNSFQSGELTRMSEGGFLRESEPKIFGPIVRKNKNDLGGLGSQARTGSSSVTIPNDNYQVPCPPQSRQWYFGGQNPNSVLTTDHFMGVAKLGRTLECYNNTTNREIQLGAEQVTNGNIALFITKPSANGSDMKDGWRKIWRFGIAYKLMDGSNSWTNVQNAGSHCIATAAGLLTGFEITNPNYDLTRTHGTESSKIVTMPGASADIGDVDMTMVNGVLNEIEFKATPSVTNLEAFEIDGLQMGGSAAVDSAGYVYASNAHLDFELDLTDIATYTQNPRFEIGFKENLLPPNMHVSDIGKFMYDKKTESKVSNKIGGNANYRDPRITGFMVFMYSPEDLSQGDDVPWLPCIEVDLVRKQYKNHTHDKQWLDLVEHRERASASGAEWIGYSTGPEFAHDGTSNSEEVPTTYGTTYSTAILYNSNEDTKVKWRASTVVNGRAVIGNVLKDGVTYNDRIMVSAPGSIDVFPEEYSYDAAQSDGQGIVALKSWADKLLVFKEKNFYIYNATNTNDIFIEGEYEYYGVLCPSAIVESDYGITWLAHNMGVMHYDGQKVKSLNEGKLSLTDLGLDKTDINGVPTGIRTKDKPVISFIPHEKLLLVIPDVYHANVDYGSGSFQTGNWTNDAWAYDFDSQDWTVMQGFLYSASAGHSISNIVNNEDKGVIFALNNNDSGIYPSAGAFALMTLNPSELITFSANKKLSFKTKEIDFGDVAMDKHVYKVIFKYKGVAGIAIDNNKGLKIQAVINGDYTSLKDFDDTLMAGNWRLNHLQGFDGATQFTPQQWCVQDLRPKTANEFRNIKTLALVATHGSSNNVHSEFELDSISIVYRVKGVSTGGIV